MYSVITQAEVLVSHADGFSLRSGLIGVWRLHKEGFTLEGFSGGKQWCLEVHRLSDLGQRPMGDLRHTYIYHPPPPNDDNKT